MVSSTSPPPYDAIQHSGRPASNEQTPLNGPKLRRRARKASIFVFVFILVLGYMVLGLTTLYFIGRKGTWEVEHRRVEKKFEHQKEIWSREQLKREEEQERRLQRQKEDWKKEQLKREEDQERRFQRRKEDWKKEQMDKEMDLERRKVAWRNEEAQRESTRHQWAVEEARMDSKRKGWADADRAREEDEQHRIRAGLRWTEVQPSERCLRFGTREYSAQILHLPDDFSDSKKVEWCYRTEVEIHGRAIESPNLCEVIRYGNQPGVYAHWTVSVGEPSCETWWEDFHDEGCVASGSGMKRIRARLGNHLPPWDNWKDMCATTPVDMYGRHFDQPDACNEWGRQGIMGFWFLPDDNCRAFLNQSIGATAE